MNLKIIYFFLVVLTANSQVKIGDNSTVLLEGSLLELESTDKALVITRVNDVKLITNPIVGMLVYELSTQCYRCFIGQKWSSCLSDKYDLTDLTSIVQNGVLDRNYGDGVHDFIYKEIVGEDGKIWLNNNLGADYSNVNHSKFNYAMQAENVKDIHAFGSSFQWGRKADGHELIEWKKNGSVITGVRKNGTTITRVDNPNHSQFIASELNEDWRIIFNNNLWDGVNAVNNPCPVGFKVPSNTEIRNYLTSAGLIPRTTSSIPFDNISSNLKFAFAGRSNTTGTMINGGSAGYYATSTTSDNKNFILHYFNNTSATNIGNIKLQSYTVRCIKK